MIQPYTRLNIADNSGAKIASCIRVLSRGRSNFALIGDIISVSVKSASPRGQAKKKEVCRAVIVRQTKPYRRADGTVLRFDDNAAVLLNPDNTPRGTRIFGPIARELREKGFSKIVSMAQEVV